MARILVIDDQSCVGELLSEELHDEGHQIMGVDHSESVWVKLADFRPDVVLLDLYSNGFEGWDILYHIKATQPNLPVLVFTAYDTLKNDARLSQADGYVVKSFGRLGKLKEKVSDVLARRTPRQPKETLIPLNAVPQTP